VVEVVAVTVPQQIIQVVPQLLILAAVAVGVVAMELLGTAGLVVQV
jgi:hypothetical protein